MASRPRTLYEKIWDAHEVERREDGTSILYIDRHLVHEVTQPAGVRSPALIAAARCADRT